MRIVSLLFIVGLAGLSSALRVPTWMALTDECNKWPTCQQCVAAPYCGWCSEPVVYENGAKGYNCAGLSSSGSNNFTCNGVFSTETCQQGYACNETISECYLTAPGTGVPQDQCQANCSTVGKTFLCDNTTHQCVVAPAGEGTSHHICVASCSPSNPPQSHAPASSSPASASPASPHPVSPGPTPPPLYACNTSTFKCEPSVPGKGASHQVCVEGCKPHNVTPVDLVGLWRAITIDDVHQPHEYDLEFSHTAVRIASRDSSSKCEVQSISSNEVWLINCAAPEVKNMKCLWEDSPGMPETFHAMLACNIKGGAAPSHFTAAISSDDYSVWFLSRCVPGGACKFHWGPSVNSTHDVVEELVNVQSIRRPLQSTDPCEAFGSNCTYCLAHSECGWCSTNVIYGDGTVGTQCAGVNPNGSKNPFKCTGTFTTDMCLPGYTCDQSNQTCVPTTPGAGMPKEECTTACKAMPGPPSILVGGDWRGIWIQNGYPFGLVIVNVSSSSIKFKMGGKTVLAGTVTNLGSDIFIKITEGPSKGGTLAGMWANTANSVIQYVTIAFGGVNSDAPTTFAAGMTAPGTEIVMAKCSASSCTW